MKVDTKSKAAIQPRQGAQNPELWEDVAGIALIALGLLCLLALALPDTGLVGGALGSVLRSLFGRGAWAMPFVTVVIGGSLVFGRRWNEVPKVVWGLSLVYVALLGVFARGLQGDFFDPQVAEGSGGYVGAVVGWLFQTLFGSAKWVGLGALGMIGLILAVGAPIRTIVGRRARRPAEGRPTPRRAVVQAPERPAAPVRQEPSPGAPNEEPRRARPAPVIRETVQAGGPTLESIPKEGYQLPPMGLLAAPQDKPRRSREEMERNIRTLEGTLEEFGIEATVVEVATGPTITRYEVQLGPGIRVARITALADNIAMNLAASNVRVEAPIPGKSAIGVEVPNAHPTTVTLRDVCDTPEFRDHPSRLWVALGQDVSGVNKYADLARMPHLLIGGATNSGKSIGLSAIIMSLLLRNTPKDVRMVMIDPKRVELTLFDNIPHLLCPVVKDVSLAPSVLRAVKREMDRRYDLFSQEGVRNIEGWNKRASFQDRLSYIVVVIDELADLMMQAAAEVETVICRLAQLARATGIHLVIATQRPSVDVITGTIKANIASRIAFTVSSQIDSRTILDQAGAERLIGRGDMLFLPIDASKPLRIQGCYVSEQEIDAVCEFWRAQEKPAYTLRPVEASEDGRERGSGSADDALDPLWEEAVRWVVERGQASTSMLQRKFSIGFQRASRLLDEMEERGIVGPRDGPRPRDVLVDPLQLETLFGGGRVYTGEEPYPDEDDGY
ncbi:MAG: DNA translocase FtsK [Fimbriimonadales bacterium]|nr:DNA translocase FtsK [Fimbriimonadales bacterium]